MSKASLKARAIKAINEQGALLVFPMDNKPKPPALWHALHPRTKMRWEWDDDGDSRVANLWYLRMELSESSQVVYSKWFRGRATFFSRDCFVDLLRVMNAADVEQSLVGDSRDLYEALLESSPRSTKELKKATELVGKSFESHFQKGMKKLFENGLIVGFGEVDDGAFPSLACGTTSLMFEELWEQGKETEKAEAAYERLRARLAPEFIRFLDQILSKKNGSKRT